MYNLCPGRTLMGEYIITTPWLECDGHSGALYACESCRTWGRNQATDSSRVKCMRNYLSYSAAAGGALTLAAAQTSSYFSFCLNAHFSHALTYSLPTVAFRSQSDGMSEAPKCLLFSTSMWLPFHPVRIWGRRVFCLKYRTIHPDWALKHTYIFSTNTIIHPSEPDLSLRVGYT